MGNSISCFPADHPAGRKVLVFKENGESIRVKEGTLVKDVLTAHRYHKVIRCCADRSVLPGSYRLSSNQLYFLLPEGLDVCDTTYRSLIRTTVLSDETILSKVIDKATNQKIPSEVGIIDGEVVDMVVSFDDDPGHKKSAWRPALQTIPEVLSPAVHADG
ncbi:unnamed protein product [Ilex paraguariensis]|uniref:Doublecortin domain-containing protein n=1 Tax=Ilex paraguariensis TaxID=185542 RepID=A0ABC8UNB0_9AQUA